MRKWIFCLLIFLLIGCAPTSQKIEKTYTLQDAIAFLQENQFDYSKDYHLTVYEKCNEDEYNISDEYFYHLPETNVYLLDTYSVMNQNNTLMSYSLSLADTIHEDGFDLKMYSCNLNRTILSNQEDNCLHLVNPIEENKIDFNFFYEDECKKVEINENEVILTYDDYIITIGIMQNEITSYTIVYTNGTCMSTSLYSHELDDYEKQIKIMKEFIGKDIDELNEIIPKDLEQLR